MAATPNLQRTGEPQTTGLTRPASATHFGVSLLALLVGVGLVWLGAPWMYPAMNQWLGYSPLIPCAGIVLVIAAAEWLRPAWRNPLAEAPRGVVRPLSLARVGTRLLGVAATFALLALAYWLFPEYHGTFYTPYWQFLRSIAPLAVAIPFYLVWMDTRSASERDEYFQMGALLLGHGHLTDWPLLRRHLLGWTIKGFFLPLMTVYLGNEIRALYQAIQPSGSATADPYQIFYHLSYAVDLLYCVVGYSSALRWFDSHIRSVEPTVGGWVIALMCYQPFYSVIGAYYLQYEDATFWDNWLQAWPNLRDAWAVAIIILASIYALATVAFGLRFSNLTHRGIITSGPYRFSKHPAYLSKNLSWWLISVPFISQAGWTEALRNCTLLALLNGVYYLRARTEEWHLSRDPTYVQYALWMEQHGWLRPLARVLPFIRYHAAAERAT